MEQVAEHRPQELRLRMRAGAQCGELLGGILSFRIPPTSGATSPALAR
jgi:hypothetical protein